MMEEKVMGVTLSAAASIGPRKGGFAGGSGAAEGGR